MFQLTIWSILYNQQRLARHSDANRLWSLISIYPISDTCTSSHETPCRGAWPSQPGSCPCLCRCRWGGWSRRPCCRPGVGHGYGQVEELQLVVVIILFEKCYSYSPHILQGSGSHFQHQDENLKNSEKFSCLSRSQIICNLLGRACWWGLPWSHQCRCRTWCCHHDTPGRLHASRTCSLLSSHGPLGT